jgi:membrane protein YqaA with SNARE-associated domain
VLFAMIRAGEPAGLLLAVAAVGNTLGSVVNWLLGRYLLHFQHRKWFYFKPAQIEKMQAWFQRYGVWSLLLAWMPIGGDPLTLVAGIMRVNLWLFIVLVGIGKTLRYVAVIYFSEMSVAWF